MTTTVFTALARAFCGANAVMYAVFAAWCWWSPHVAGEQVGLRAISAGGISEFQAVYAGMEAGFAVFYALSALRQELLLAALWFSALIYGGIVMFRTMSILSLGFSSLGPVTRSTYFLEISLLAVSLLLLQRGARMKP